MKLDHSVYPDLEDPPDDLPTPEDKADYVHRICAFDFGVFPERDDWIRFAGWRDIFDRFPLPHSPAHHTFRARYGWPEAERRPHGLVPGWKIADLREEREDPCEHMVRVSLRPPHFCLSERTGSTDAAPHGDEARRQVGEDQPHRHRAIALVRAQFDAQAASGVRGQRSNRSPNPGSCSDRRLAYHDCR